MTRSAVVSVGISKVSSNSSPRRLSAPVNETDHWETFSKTAVERISLDLLPVRTDNPAANHATKPLESHPVIVCESRPVWAFWPRCRGVQTPAWLAQPTQLAHQESFEPSPGGNLVQCPMLL